MTPSVELQSLSDNITSTTTFVTSSSQEPQEAMANNTSEATEKATTLTLNNNCEINSNKNSKINSNHRTVPQLQNYQGTISYDHGFLPLNPPLKLRLSSYYEPWESIVDHLSDYLKDGSLKLRIDELPLLSLDHLVCPRDWQRAYTVLSFLGNGYVWHNLDQPASSLPLALSEPWYKSAQYLGLKPVVTYAGVELFNFKILDESKPLTLENLKIYQTFTGTRDEEWFLRISLAIEAKGGQILKCIMTSIQSVVNENKPELAIQLELLVHMISQIYDILARMGDHDDQGKHLNDPNVFYHVVRPCMAGWSGSLKLPDGIEYHYYEQQNGIVDGQVNSNLVSVREQYAGASAGQSPIIHCLDAALGVQHYPTISVKRRSSYVSSFSQANTKNNNGEHNTTVDTKDGSKLKPLKNDTQNEHSSEKNSQDNTETSQQDGLEHKLTYIYEMRKYMLKEHRQFIDDVANGPSIRDYIENLKKLQSKTIHDSTEAHFDSNSDNDVVGNGGYAIQEMKENELNGKIIDAYNDCIDNLKKFRDYHIQLVSRYIIIPSMKEKEGKGNLNVVLSEHVSAKGTGGTDLMPFLKQMRDETTCKI